MGLAACGQHAVDLAIRHVQDREQFGRPLARFQAVQHLVAEAKGEAASAAAAVERAVEVVVATGFGRGSTLPVAVARAPGSAAAAGRIARLAHQVDGAMGFTLEHELRCTTTRLLVVARRVRQREALGCGGGRWSAAGGSGRAVAARGR
ncbi:MAG: acyl-CoA dehydrogenase [Sporichthya sp.]|nr:acyl-CoA dehydrogenase [Sporichthya sp.]